MDRQSPLLFPVTLVDKTIFVLDETALPFQEIQIPVNTLDDALSVLKEMKTRSLGQVFLFFYSCLLFSKEYPIEVLAQKFKAMRPTFDFSMLAHIVTGNMQKGISLEQIVKHFIYGFDFMRRVRAEKLAQLLIAPAHIVTICNVNGELIYLYEELKKLGKETTFYVCETRPYLQGTRLTFWELEKNNIPCRLMCDNQAAYLMQQGKVNAVVVGADRATTKGDIINKIGTYALARLAHYYTIPFYALTQYPRDIDIESIPIEERPEEECFMFLKEDPGMVNAVYPAFDITRAEFITQCIEMKAVLR